MQLTLEFARQLIETQNSSNNKLRYSDRAFHDWYRFVLSYPPHLVQEYIAKFNLLPESVVLDPFCGTGTTLVEAKKRNIHAIGIEAHPMAHFASQVKTDWSIDAQKLQEHAKKLYDQAERLFKQEGDDLRCFTPEQSTLLLKESISALPLHKCLILLDVIKNSDDKAFINNELLALAWTSVMIASNLKFGPEVGVSKSKKVDAAVFEEWLKKISTMIRDLRNYDGHNLSHSQCILGDSRNIIHLLKKESVDAVITSPPYPNEKDYTRTTRLESTLLGFIQSKDDLRRLKHTLIRSNTRNVYMTDDDDLSIGHNSKITKIAREIERRRIALHKNSGFERQYHRVTKLYFGGMKRHFEQLRPILKPGARLAYVVGDQASYLQVMIRTGELLAEIADDLGYDVLGLDLFRTRLSTATGEQLREEVLVLEWNGGKTMSDAHITSRYDQLIEKVFFNNYTAGAREVSFAREEFIKCAEEVNIILPKNLGDIIYSYRYRNRLPARILDLLQEGEEWIIRSVGKGKYLFVKSPIHLIAPNPRLSKISIPDATPEIIRRYALNDEQALLAILRYNRLIDIFSEVACYSLQNHLRTFVANMGQVETDEIYIGVNKKGEQFVLPVQAKGKNEHIGIIQIEQDAAMCKEKFPALTCRPIAAQFIEENLIAMFEFEQSAEGLTIKEERHYRLAPNEELSEEEIIKYRSSGLENNSE